MPGRTLLVFLPGLLCDDRLWRDQAAALADIAEPAIADLTLDDSVAAMAARVLAGAPERFALAALSMGGYVAFEMLRRAPERITRLALLDTSAARDTPGRAVQRRAAMESLKLGRFQGVTTRMLPQLVHARHGAACRRSRLPPIAAGDPREAGLASAAPVHQDPDAGGRRQLRRPQAGCGRGGESQGDRWIGHV